MSTFNTYWIIELLKSGIWKPADDCAYSSGMPVQAAALWVGRDGDEGVRIVRYSDDGLGLAAEWNREGERIV